MENKVSNIRKLLKEIDEEYASNPNLAEELEAYRQKHAALTEEDLSTQFTI